VTEQHYRLAFSAAAARQLRKLDQAIAAHLRATTEALCVKPRPPGVKALQGRRGYLRIRVGDYRVVYTIRDDRLLILVVAVGHRGDVYRNMS
jgi:mRNA interferase RelE/StbE